MLRTYISGRLEGFWGEVWERIGALFFGDRIWTVFGIDSGTENILCVVKTRDGVSRPRCGSCGWTSSSIPSCNCQRDLQIFNKGSVKKLSGRTDFEHTFFFKTPLF